MTNSKLHSTLQQILFTLLW